MYGSLVSLLYEISFVGLVGRPNDQAVYSFQASAPAPNGGVFEATLFEIHPAFRQALNIRG